MFERVFGSREAYNMFITGLKFSLPEDAPLQRELLRARQLRYGWVGAMPALVFQFVMRLAGKTFFDDV
jgi:hypothetical protein